MYLLEFHGLVAPIPCYMYKLYMILFFEYILNKSSSFLRKWSNIVEIFCFVHMKGCVQAGWKRYSVQVSNAGCFLTFFFQIEC